MVDSSSMDSNRFCNHHGGNRALVKPVEYQKERILLPWQMRLLFPGIGMQSLIEEGEDLVIVEEKDSLSQTRREFIFSRVLAVISGAWSSLAMLIAKQRQSLRFFSKAALLFTLGLIVLNVVGNWYKSAAEYELLLDKADSEFHDFGCSLFELGSPAELSSLAEADSREEGSDSEARDMLDYDQAYILQNLRVLVSAPCFPRRYGEYALTLAREISKTIVDIEKMGRKRRKTSTSNIAHKSNSTGSSRGLKEVALGSDTRLDGVFVRYILYLQTQQTEISLRHLRNTLCSHANTCEELLVYWENALRNKIQKKRSPLSKERVWVLIARFKYNLMYAYKSLSRFRWRRSESGSVIAGRDLTDKEKILSLHTLISELYCSIGAIQLKLDDIDQLRRSLRLSRNDSVSSREMGVEANEWMRLSHWLHDAASLCDETCRSLRLKQNSVEANDTMNNGELSDPNGSSNRTQTNYGKSCGDKSIEGLIARNDYYCQPSTLQRLIGMVSGSGNHSSERIRIGEFFLPIGLHDTISVCLIQNNVFSSALHSSGDEILSNGTWYHYMPRNTSDFKNAVWMKQVSYRHFDKGVLFGKIRNDYSLMQVLNISNIDTDINKTGSVWLATYVNATQRLFRYGYNYTVLSHFLCVPKDLHSSRRTRVIVEAEVDVPHSRNPFHRMLVHGDLTKYLREFVGLWKSSALYAISEDSYAEKKRPVSESEDRLHRLIEQDEDDDTLHATTIPARGTISSMLFSSNKRNRGGEIQPSLQFMWLKAQSRINLALSKDTARSTTSFTEYLEHTGLKPKSSFRIFQVFRLKRLFGILLWVGVWAAATEASKRWDEIIMYLQLIMLNANDFFNRRIKIPTMSIFNDVLLNKKLSLTDKEALVDAKRSLTTMLYDFLVQHGPKMSDGERKRIASNMDMTPISKEYELELRRPMQNILSGRLARLVLIQLQFVKKELLMAMEGLDELFSSNQVNLQLMAVTPAVLIILLSQSVFRRLGSAIVSTSRGRFIESAAAAQRGMRDEVRMLERLLTTAPVTPPSIIIESADDTGNKTSTTPLKLINFTQSEEEGRVLGRLHKMQRMLLFNAVHFDAYLLKHLQEDLRDLAEVTLSAEQRLVILERIVRSYPFMQAGRSKAWGM